MKGINLSPTSQEILSIYFASPGKKFYVNELIRATGRYPNSIQQALKSLEKQDILIASRKGRLKLYSLSNSCGYLNEIRSILKKRGYLGETVTEEGISDRWVKTVNRRGSVPFVAMLATSGRDHVSEVLKDSGMQGYWYNSITGGSYFESKYLQSLGRKVSVKLDVNLKFASKLARSCEVISNKFVRESSRIRKFNLPKLTKKDLYKILNRYYVGALKTVVYLYIPLAIERDLLEKIKNSLKEYLGLNNSSQKRLVKYEKYFDVLTSPTRLGREELEDALKIAAYIKKYGFNRHANKLIDSHTDKYQWLPLEAALDEPLKREYFEREIKSILKKVKDPQKELEKGRNLEMEQKEKVENVFKDIKASRHFRVAVKLLQDFVYLRTHRINSQSKANLYHQPLVYEIGQRMQLEKEEIKLLTYEEMLKWLKHGYGRRFGYSYEGLRKEIRRRQNGWAVLMWKGKIRIISGVKNIIETMERYKIVAPGPQAVKVIKGNPACRGQVTGRVKIVRKLSELNKVENGDILVAKMTTPDYMIAIHKAAAIITDEGGVTCHAAIVSREFNVPCIVGTKNATQMLSDNDIVEVDANEGVVRVVEAVDVDEDVRQIYGKTAYKGKVRGLVRIVLDANDFPKVKEGDILVAPQTTPEYLSSLYKVKGFIVDEDSITSHAMLYAKALKLPAIIGTQFARNVLKDGEKVELDATRGVVKRV